MKHLTSFMAKMKVYEAYKNGKISEEQANYFIDLMDKAEIQIQLYDKFLTNEYNDVLNQIYKDCRQKASNQGFEFDLKHQNGVFASRNSIFNLKAHAIYLSKTSVLHKHKQVYLEDITGETVYFPIADISKAKGNHIIEEKYILLDYLKNKMDERPDFKQAYKELREDIRFTTKNM